MKARIFIFDRAQIPYLSAMSHAKAYAATTAKSPLTPFTIERRTPGAHDVVIENQFCGVCHSDIHQARDEWGGSLFPMVPGHEILGIVKAIGTGVTKFQVGDLVGVGCFVDSCRACSACQKGLQQYCEGKLVVTYNGTEKDGETPTYGGYSSQIVVDENYVLRVPKSLSPERAAPLLCAGITTYSPLRHVGVTKGHRVGVMGLGGLGHMGVKFAAAFGAEVTVLSTSLSKQSDANRLGAHEFVNTKDENKLSKFANYFDVILNTVSAQHALNRHLNLLKTDGTMILVGVPEQPYSFHPFPLIMKRRRLLGSLIGGIAETQEMLDFCGKNEIMSDIELIAAKEINNAYERMIRGDVKYRFVIDLKTL